jgi:outer membrane protein assembly factor BamD (BamD/ComL family)
MMLKYRYFLNNKFIILIITLIAFVSYNCSTFILSSKNIEIREYLSCSKKLLKQKKYEQAIKKNKMILDKYTKNPWKDRILFNLGYLYSYYDNPEKIFQNQKLIFKDWLINFPTALCKKRAKFG